MTKLNVQTPFNIDLEFDVASLWKRAGAYLLDVLVGSVYVLILHLTILEESNDYFGLLEASHFFLVVLPLYFYHFLSEMLMNGQSLGKKAFGIRVVNNNGNAASTSQYLLRWILSIPNLFFILAAYFMWFMPIQVIMFLGFASIPDLICYAVTKNGKRIGDLAANTVVVNLRYNMDIDQTIFRDVSTDIGYQAKYPEVMRLTDKDINNIRNLLTQKRNKDLDSYTERVAQRIEVVLKIENKSGDAYYFFEELLMDYNYFIQTR